MFGLSIETMFALTLLFQGLILAFLLLNIRVFGRLLEMVDCIHEMVHEIEESSEAVEQAFLSKIKDLKETQDIQNLEDWT